ncbi:MAG: M15 family metallopeptidase, partial [Glaciimonas sp.]|nr:M15 family metallopeptidase [Glaciimonas sp.]
MKNLHRLFAIIFIFSTNFAIAEPALTLPQDASIRISDAPTWRQFLRDASEEIPGIEVEGRYYGDYNFVGKRLDGYLAPKCLLTPAAITALKATQESVNKQGYHLKTYDCYRPQMTVDQFVLWAQDLQDTQMKSVFYPTVDKTKLFSDGYIAAKSGHSRGSTLDITIVPNKNPHQARCIKAQEKICQDNSLDMGSSFDYFGVLSHIANQTITPQQQKNRQILQDAMHQHGFKSLDEEWWHFT